MAIVSVGAGFVAATVAGVGLASGTTTATPSVYSSIAPVTVLGRSLAADSNTDVTVAGVGSVPSNATSVQLSVTALSGTTTSSMYVYATGATKPTSANVRWQTGETVTIPVTVAVGTAGKIHLNTDAGTVTIKVAVVGYFSPAPAPGSTADAATANGVAITSTDTTVASVNVAAGTYEVQATAILDLTSGTSGNLDCEIKDPTQANVDSFFMLLLSSAGGATPMSMVGLDTTSGGAMTLVCDDGSNNGEADDVELVATQLSSAGGVVTGS